MKSKTHYVCQSCGTSSARWLGRCVGCGEWNTLIEEAFESTHALSSKPTLKSPNPNPEIHALSEERESAPPASRIKTGMNELDRVLGGGLVPDSLVLVGGDPGIGKSTLLLQMAEGVARTTKAKIAYISGEESIDQIRSRALRLGVRKESQIFLASETLLETAMTVIEKVSPQIIVIDSLQTIASSNLESAPGSVSQVREIALRLMHLAKSQKVAVWLVGHVTKDGNIAGPKVVEHMVDTVLYFEGDGAHSYRILRAVKNRFGSIREMGVFEMQGEGLQEVTNPSSLFLSERAKPVAGTAVTASLEGTRPLLLEIQALVAASGLAMPRRTAVGMEQTRLSMLTAVLERHMGLNLSEKDVFLNVAGGFRLNETACDLAIAAAVWSSAKDVAIPSDTVFMGELGLTGEVRKIPQIETRLREALKLGFKKAIIPKNAWPKDLSKSEMVWAEIQSIRDLPSILRP